MATIANVLASLGLASLALPITQQEERESNRAGTTNPKGRISHINNFPFSLPLPCQSQYTVKVQW
jgi:hypothetical protein